MLFVLFCCFVLFRFVVHFCLLVHFCLPFIGVEGKPSNADGGVPVINKSAVDILFTVT
jgi:hypothetical protein